MTKPTVLLTGATGFLGSHLLEAMLHLGYPVVVLKRSASDLWRIEHLIGQFKSYDVDTQPISSSFSEQRIDLVLNLATYYKKFEDSSDIEQMIYSNVTFPSQVLMEAVTHNVKGFINTGTFFEFDCSKQPVSENSDAKPFNFYSRTKMAFETILKTYAENLCINTFYLFSPFGEKDNTKLLPIIIQGALSKQPIYLSEGFQKIDLIYVADIVDVYLSSILRQERNNFAAEYETFNIGSGQALSIRDIASIIGDLVGCPLNITWGKPSMNDIPIAYADTSKANKILGWSPKVGLKAGLQKTIKFYERVD